MIFILETIPPSFSQNTTNNVNSGSQVGVVVTFHAYHTSGRTLVQIPGYYGAIQGYYTTWIGFQSLPNCDGFYLEVEYLSVASILPWFF